MVWRPGLLAVTVVVAAGVIGPASGAQGPPSNMSGVITLDSLNNVSCTNSANCTAIGVGRDHLGQTYVAAEWNGKTWRLQIIPSRDTLHESLPGLS